MNERQAIEEQLRDWLGSVEQQGSLSKVAIMHVAAQGGQVEIHSLADSSPGWKDAGKMADVIDTISKRHSGGLPGYQQYQVEASFGASVKPTRFLPFGRMGMMSFGQTSIGTEPPTQLGQVSQGMRLTELLAQLGVKSIEAALQSLLQQNAALSKDLEASRYDARELQIAVFEHQRKFIELQAESHMKFVQFLRQSREREQWMRMTPAIINALSGHEVFPMSSEDTALLRGLIEKGDPAALDAELRRLTEKNPETAAALSNRVKEIRAQIAESETELRKMAQSAEAVDMDAALAEVSGEARPRLTNGSNGGTMTKPTGPVSKWDRADVDLRWDLPSDRAVAREKVDRIVTDAARELDTEAKWDGDVADIEIMKGPGKGAQIEVLFGEQLRIKVKLPGLTSMMRPMLEKQLKAQVSEALR